MKSNGLICIDFLGSRPVVEDKKDHTVPAMNDQRVDDIETRTQEVESKVTSTKSGLSLFSTDWKHPPIIVRFNGYPYLCVICGSTTHPSAAAAAVLCHFNHFIPLVMHNENRF